MVEVLGIDVDDDLLADWRGWFCPESQPFHVSLLSDELRGHVPPGSQPEPTDEVRDTFFVYSRGWQCLTHDQFAALPRDVRRALAATRDRSLGAVRWPQDLVRTGDEPLLRYVKAGVVPSRHHDVDETTWAACAASLPEARALAGTFARRSGPNCFGTVMAAAGVPGAADEWMMQEPFERWLRERCESSGRGHDDEPGVVLVWRDRDGLAIHAAVTLGDGWALNKPAQAWCSPRFVWTVRDVVLRGRCPGARLARYQILPRRSR